MKIDTLLPIVDWQPLYEALAEYKDQGGLLDATTKRFLRRKILSTCRKMADVAKYVAGEVEVNPIPSKAKETKS